MTGLKTSPLANLLEEGSEEKTGWCSHAPVVTWRSVIAILSLILDKGIWNIHESKQKWLLNLLKQSSVLVWLDFDTSSYRVSKSSMQATPNRTSKIPRRGTMSPRVSQGSKSPTGSGSPQENGSPQLPVEDLASTSIHDEAPFASRLTQGLEDCNWEQLQGKYADAMDEHGRVEENIRVETAKLLEVSLKACSTCNFVSEQSVGFHGMVSNYCFARWEQGFEKVRSIQLWFKISINSLQVQNPNAARSKFRSQCGKQKEAL